ncbi:MAG TPA: cytochrome c [Caldilineaceae bacterium]|nr:cytochrome c [Caldilineaceae bacterium]
MSRLGGGSEGRGLRRWLWLMGLLALLAACNSQDPTGARVDLLAVQSQGFTAAIPTPTPTTTPDLSDDELIALGQSLYTVNCAPCHQSNGEGNLPYFPALNGNALVTADPPTALIRTVLHGRREMPAFASALSDLELAAILSYVRNAWSNNASVVRPDQINAP